MLPAVDSEPDVPPTLFPLARRRQLLEAAAIWVGVFLGVGVIAWLLSSFVITEPSEQHTTLELLQERNTSRQMELPLGQFRLASENLSERDAPHQPPSVQIVEIDASVLLEGSASDFNAVEKLLDSREFRIEEAIDEIIRSASPADLSQADALLIRTRVRDRLNSLLGRPLVTEVVFSHFRAFQVSITK